MSESITLRKINNDLFNSEFFNEYKSLLIGSQNISFEEGKISILFKLALMLINYGDEIVKKFGYRLILRYSNQFNDYRPLYDYSIASDFIPISKFIERLLETSDYQGRLTNGEDVISFNSLILTAYEENYKLNNIYLTKGQKELYSFSKKEKNDFVIVAPTSYGKSEMMLNLVKENPNKKICIIVPTKALLSQTKKNIISMVDLNEVGRIIVHPDMYTGDEKFVAVLTQERLLRLLQKDSSVNLDLVLVDEAHCLLEDTHRADLLAFVLIILKKRNPGVAIKYFTPFLLEPDNIKIPYLKTELKSKRSNESLKVERFFYIEKDNQNTEISIYDQFMNSFYQVDSFGVMSDVELILRYSGFKNIVYLNKTKNIEEVSETLSTNVNQVVDSQEILEICENIADYLHKDYNLISYIKKGVLYHHGTMPDLIRLYVEHVFREKRLMRFIVTSSTLLEGVNIPSDKMFILDNKKGNSNLTPAQLKNLVGRVSRFKDVFNYENGSLKLLEPEIFIVKGEHTSKGSNIKNFIEKCLYEGREIKDSKDNVMLKNETELEKLSLEEKNEYVAKIEILENIEPKSIDNKPNIKYAKSDIGKACFLNNIIEFNIIENEDALVKNLEIENLSHQLNDALHLMGIIVNIFLTDTVFKKKQESLLRLKNEKAQKFYAMMLTWRMSGSSYKKLISNFVGYWNTLQGDDAKIYVGTRWGEIKWNSDDLFELYVDISKKSSVQKVNLAILRIKEEQDFIDNSLMKFIEILNDLGMLNKDFYEMIKYGSNDPKMICLLKNGFSIELARYILEEAPDEYVEINVSDEKVKIRNVLLDDMRASKVNDILIFELQYHVNIQL